MSPQRYGLDFGTSNSAIATVRDGRVQVFAVDPRAPNPQVASSVLYVRRDGTDFVGAEAIDAFVAGNTGREIVRAASRRAARDTAYGDEFVQFDADVDQPGRLFQAIKSFLSDESFEGTLVFGKFYTLEELAAAMIRALKTHADEINEQPLDAVVMGRPVHFSTDKKADQPRKCGYGRRQNWRALGI